MEGLPLGQSPKFKSPEEEIAFLRAKIAEREQLIQEAGGSANQEKVVEATIEEYKKADAKDILHEARVMPEHEVESLVLQLKPEPHDRKMEELLGILMDKGIKTALDIVAALHNPHVDADFHRFLVQYLAATKGIPGLREGTPIWKGVDMKLFEITLPEQDKGDTKGYKEFIQAMEQFYAGMLHVGGAYNTEQKYYTLEIAMSNAGSQVMFYAAVPTDKVDLFEKQILGFYQDAKLREVTDDYNVFTEEGFAVGSFARFGETEVYPIKIHENIEHDPMNAIVNAFSKIKDTGEGAAIQFIIMPEGEKLVKDFSQVLYRVKTEKLRAREAVKQMHSVAREAFHTITSMFKDQSAKEKAEANQRDIENIQNKLKFTVLNVGIRVVTSAATKERAQSILNEIESAFNQFNEPMANRIEWSRIQGHEAEAFFHEYSYRQIDERELMPMNLRELSSVFHFPVGVSGSPQLKQAKAATAPIPLEMKPQGILLGTNEYRGQYHDIFMAKEDRVRHCYVIGQTGTGKTVFLKNMIIQDIKNGDGVCFIDPHGSDIQDILANIPKERIDDVIYFDPAYMDRPMGLNMLEYDVNYPEQKTFVVNELLAIFNKLFDMKTAGGPAFEQYFRNSALLVMEDPASGMTLLEIGRVLADKEFRDLKLSRCKNPIIKQFWQNAEQTSGEQSLANFVPYVTNKFDVFISNDIMRPVVAQEKSVFNFREIMDNRKILLVNLAKGRLGDINANLIGLILVGKITMAALSRVDILGKQEVHDFYLYIDEFQNVTTDSIAVILSEARKYRLSLNIAHQYVEQLEDNIKNAVFGNVGTMVIHRVSPENAAIFEKQLEPTFAAQDVLKLENLHCYVKMLVNGVPAKPFNSHTPFPPKGSPEMAEKLKELSYLKYGRAREEVEAEIMGRYNAY